MITPLLFSLGQIVATPDAIRRMTALHIDPGELLARHAKGDWGELDMEDWSTNNHAMVYGGRLLSSYGKDDKRIWIITEADRSVTTLLLPENY